VNPYYEPWTESAACREIDGDTWFPEKGEDHASPKKICLTSCTVRKQCLDFAMRREQGKGEASRAGIFGGLTPGKRRKYEPEWLAEQEVTAA
jgi:hypothetical protein